MQEVSGSIPLGSTNSRLHHRYRIRTAFAAGIGGAKRPQRRQAAPSGSVGPPPGRREGAQAAKLSARPTGGAQISPEKPAKIGGAKRP